MDTQKEIVERLKQANNVLVTVSNDPSVDQLAACLGLSLALNKLDKHAAAIYSGKTPSTIEFLDPGASFETTTDSLRDFIISLDKSKADKLRYKVEDDVVRIFITPYRASISEHDLQYSQGDFNVDVVVALGVHEPHELDQAVTAHGRILHDATVITLNTQPGAELGGMNWLNESASGLSEMVTEIVTQLDDEMLDEQTATALLTGIVAETERFSNEKTSANTMKLSATLMAAGANQQLVATKLEEPAQPVAPEQDSEQSSGRPDEPEEENPNADLSQIAVNDDGTLEINHPHEAVIQPTKHEDTNQSSGSIGDLPQESDFRPSSDSEKKDEEILTAELPPEQPIPEIKKDRRTLLPNLEPEQETTINPETSSFDPPTPTGQPSAIQNTILSHDISSATDADTKPAVIESIESAFELPAVDEGMVADHLAPVTEATPPQGATLEDLERQFAKPVQPPTSASTAEQPEVSNAQALDSARDAVTDAVFNQEPIIPKPITALNAQPLGGDTLHETSGTPQPASSPAPVPQQPATPQPTAEQSVSMPLPQVVLPPAQPAPVGVGASNLNTPPSVPPPIMPPFGNGQ